MSDTASGWEEARKEALRQAAVESSRTSNVMELARTSTAGSPGLSGSVTFKMGPAPDFGRSRVPLDAEGMFHLSKEASDQTIRNGRELADAVGGLRKTNAQEQLKKSEQALHDAMNPSVWGWISKAFTWIAAAAAIATAVVTCGAAAIVAAACISANIALEESHAYEHMGDWAKLVSGILLTGAAAGNGFRIALTAADQLLDKTGFYEGFDVAPLLAFRGAMTATGLATSVAGWGDLTKTAGLSDTAQKLKSVANTITNVSVVATGVSGAAMAYETYEARGLENAQQRLRNQGDRFKTFMNDLMEIVQEEVKRSGRVLKGATSVEESRHSVAQSLALRG